MFKSSSALLADAFPAHASVPQSRGAAAGTQLKAA